MDMKFVEELRKLSGTELSNLETVMAVLRVRARQGYRQASFPKSVCTELLLNFAKEEGVEIAQESDSRGREYVYFKW